MRDLQASFNTRNETRGIEVRDSSCVMSHNATKCKRDKEAQAPSSQGSKQTQRKGTRNCGHTLAERNALTPILSPKFQTKSTEKNPPQITQKKSRKRRISSCNRKSFHGKIPKMNRIDTYFKPIPKKTERKCGNIQDKKGNGRSSSNELEIYIVEDVDSDSSIELMGNVFHRDHVRTETHNSVIDELNSLEIECSQEDRIITTPILGEASDTKENLPCCHAIQVTQLCALKVKNVSTNFTLGTQDNCIETYNIETDADMDVSESANNTDLHHYDKNLFQVDAETREIIRDWCGGDTFLTQQSYSGEVMERDDNTTDKDNHNDVNEHHN